MKISDIKERLVSSESFCKELEEALKKSPRDIPSTILAKTGKTFGELAEKENTTPEHLAMLALKENNMQFSSANSINWGRLVPQIVYYFSSYITHTYLHNLVFSFLYQF